MMKKIIAAGILSSVFASASGLAETLISDRFCADPSAHKFGDTFYVYATNDQENSGKYWDSTQWRLFSSKDLKSWKDEGSFLHNSVFKWAAEDAKAWAPGAFERNGKYYFYAPVGGNQIGVAVSDNPKGPFVDPINKPLVEKPRDKNVGDEPIDPAIFIDKDGQAYMYFGTRVPKVVPLGENMVSLAGDITDVVINGYPKDDPKKKYGEAPFLHQHDGKYYFTFSTGWPGQIVYATGDSPLGPFDYQGVIIDYLEINTNHHAIVQDGDKNYLFYHDKVKEGGGNYRRSILVTEMEYGENGKIKQIDLKNRKIN
ncbi:family 43 glycosylhydrolase [Catenovulum sp. 2E275]|uniref:family 43 glycosylhydrolase n=1 Tax=Catenovulum sp. 2E275 TaxID=2980497 RepID=UPI0021D0006A|nr:family 43 glycosylhydrolase [Catenovulum sp. 2E275]MCU4675257.1 family 43 glycosylhydrolase [Catenovulum sp. 2E275]